METAIEKAQRVNRERRESGEVTTITHNLIVKAKKRPNSLKAAVNAMCFACMGGSEENLPDAGWKNNIRTCTAPDCPLYPHRPYQKNSGDNEIDNESDEI